MYQIKKDGEWYVVYKNQDALLTPQGRTVKTRYQELADRLVLDLERFGEDPANPLSLVAFHYPLIDFFTQGPRAELEHSVSIGLDRESDWSLVCPSAEPNFMMRWLGTFGSGQTQSEEGKKWLSSLSSMQLCAVCVIGRTLESVNIPYIVATKLELSMIRGFAKEIVNYYPYVSVDDLKRYLDNFLFYFKLKTEVDDTRNP